MIDYDVEKGVWILLLDDGRTKVEFESKTEAEEFLDWIGGG